MYQALDWAPRNMVQEGIVIAPPPQEASSLVRRLFMYTVLTCLLSIKKKTRFQVFSNSKFSFEMASLTNSIRIEMISKCRKGISERVVPQNTKNQNKPRSLKQSEITMSDYRNDAVGMGCVPPSFLSISCSSGSSGSRADGTTCHRIHLELGPQIPMCATHPVERPPLIWVPIPSVFQQMQVLI